METLADEVVVDAPAGRVWQAIQDPREHAQWHPLVTGIEGEHAPGAVRTCSVRNGQKSATTEERCSSFEEGRTIVWTVERDSSGFSRMVSDWSAGFTLSEEGPTATRVTARSMFTPRRLMVRLVMPLIRRKFHQAQREILGGLKRHLEG
jgi:uncharacterized protein YndB with AHSA1/START domain